jgi:hypothetical protein
MASAACGSSAPTPAASGGPLTTRPSTLTSTAPTPLPDAGPGVRGRVTAGPTCPVERPGQLCPPVAVHGRVIAIDSTGQTAGSATTDDAGDYAIKLATGAYNVHVDTGGPSPRCPETPVTVSDGPPQVTDVHCDTGIR